MKKPNFFIVGAKKSGTTAMFEYLKQHPDVFMCEPKEPAHFCPDLEIPDVVSNRDDYLRLFAGAGDEKIIGEGTTSYINSAAAPCEIHEFNADSKILIMLRNPVDMVHSLHSYLVWLGWEDIKDFEEALAAEEDRRQGKRLPYSLYTTRFLFYRETVAYSGQVQNFLDVFGPEKTKIIIFDDFKKDARGAFRETCEFLEIDAGFEPHIEKVNENRVVRHPGLHTLITRPHPKFKQFVRGLLPHGLRTRAAEKLILMNSQTAARQSMPDELRHRLENEFTPDVERLSQILGRDLVTLWFSKKEVPLAP
ncbi:MAG TPA: sulfotransferase domain-containing protein [Abditibacteriaceae bacterium]|jgi:hypothetical protein